MLFLPSLRAGVFSGRSFHHHEDLIAEFYRDLFLVSLRTRIVHSYRISFVGYFRDAAENCIVFQFRDLFFSRRQIAAEILEYLPDLLVRLPCLSEFIEVNVLHELLPDPYGYDERYYNVHGIKYQYGNAQAGLLAVQRHIVRTGFHGLALIEKCLLDRKQEVVQSVRKRDRPDIPGFPVCNSS